MRHSTSVQWENTPRPDKPWLTVAGPTDTGSVEVERLSLDPKAEDVRFIEAIAEYRNTLAKVQGKKLQRRWSRKSMAENMLSLQCDMMRAEMAEMTRALGPVPRANDEEAMEKYVRRVISWDQKNSK